MTMGSLVESPRGTTTTVTATVRTLEYSIFKLPIWITIVIFPKYVPGARPAVLGWMAISSPASRSIAQQVFDRLAAQRGVRESALKAAVYVTLPSDADVNSTVCGGGSEPPCIAMKRRLVLEIAMSSEIRSPVSDAVSVSVKLSVRRSVCPGVSRAAACSRFSRIFRPVARPFTPPFGEMKVVLREMDEEPFFVHPVGRDSCIS